MKIYFCRHLPKKISLVIFFASLLPIKGHLLNAEYLYNDSQMDYSTKNEKHNSDIPTNPFEIVEMIRKFNSLNDATIPSDAIDDALESFDNLEEKSEI